MTTLNRDILINIVSITEDWDLLEAIAKVSTQFEELTRDRMSELFDHEMCTEEIHNAYLDEIREI